MSLIAYLTSHAHSLVKAALNLGDAILVAVILALILLEKGNRSIRFTGNERLCLAISCMAAAAWICTRTGLIGLVGFQVVMSIASFPTIESVWRWKPGRLPEPLESGASMRLSLESASSPIWQAARITLH